jgi:L-methionine (R)-S-oxide reductase
MHDIHSARGLSKTEGYRTLTQQAASLLEQERDGLANAANVAALIFQVLPDLNWAGFYFLRGSELVLGPFQGKVACVRIPVGKGVCGTAAELMKTIVVPDVHAFPGHIACDSASRSEIVVPLVRGGDLIGVLDVDSPVLERFDAEDARGLEALASLFLGRSHLESLGL